MDKHDSTSGSANAPDAETQAPAPPRRPMTSALLPGFIVLVLGVALLLSNFGLLPAGAWRLWPLLLIGLGIARSTRGDPPSVIWGVALTLFGVGLMLEHFSVWHVHFWQLWPVFIIAVGVTLLWTSLQGGHWGGPPWMVQGRPGAPWGRRGRTRGPWGFGGPPAHGSRSWQDPSAGGGAVIHAEDVVEVKAVFGESKRRVLNNSFRGGVLHAVFGGAVLDLRGMGTPAQPVVIEAQAVFGGIEIFVPVNWTVELQGNSMFGAYQDETSFVSTADNARGRLVVQGAVVFGGVVVKN